jgi:protocatechuate 3,4-dioxygenase, alpha subunit
MNMEPTASQTVGPYLHIGLDWLKRDQLAGPGASGERVTIAGRILDGDGTPVSDALIEVWQANAHGKYAHPDDWQDKPLESDFSGFGRVPTDTTGAFRFATIKPGSVPGPDGRTQAPHLAIAVFMRGLLKHLTTRLYFPDEPANALDPILNLLPADRRPTLVAKATGPSTLEWNIHLQGQNETVFFDC